MMEVRFANFEDASLIGNLAHEIWPVAYEDVISAEQISFMLEQSYSISAIESQMKEGHLFFILESDAIVQGFASVTKESQAVYKLQKLYIHQNSHQKGAGKLLIKSVENYCRKQGALELLLNVNRNNKAKLFYEKMGYHIIETVDIPYYKYVLNDYVMAKSLV
jgi:GNAT superfamily N-acetyltransferase